MLDKQDSHIKIFTYKADSVHQLSCLIGVHACCRLIKKQKLGVGGKSTGDLQLTLLSVGEV